MTNKIKTVKAWMIINCKNPTSIIEWSADCGCNANFYDCPPIFTKRKDALDYLSAFDGEEIVPCTISYTLPSSKVPKKTKKCPDTTGGRWEF